MVPLCYGRQAKGVVGEFYRNSSHGSEEALGIEIDSQGLCFDIGVLLHGYN